MNGEIDEQMFHAMPIVKEEGIMVASALEQLEEMIEGIIADELKWLKE